MAAQLLITVPTAANEFIPASEAVAGVLGVFPLLWSTFIIIVCSGAVSAEAGVVADSILSKAVTRYHYILAKFGARLAAMLGIYGFVALITTILISQNAENDLTRSGIAWGVVDVGILIVLLTSLSIGFSTIFNRTLVALVVVWVVWYVSSGLLAIFQLEFLSPIDIIDNLAATLRGEYETSNQLKIMAVFGGLSFVTISSAVAYFARKDL